MAAHTINVTWKLLANVCCNALTCAADKLWREASAAPAAAPPRLEKIAPASATLKLCPTTRPVARKPDALPCCSLGAEPRSALLLGDWNIACPSPVTTRRQMISQTELCALSWLMRTSPRQASARPPAASQRVPKRSASVPLSGAKIAIVSGRGVRSSPACSVLKPRRSSR